MVVLSAYFPVDSNRANKVDDAMIGLVDDLTCFLSKFPDSAVIFGVDANVDFSRKNAHSKYFEQFCEFNNLSIFQPNAPTFKSGSKFDHFLTRSSISPAVLCLPTNPSDHNLIMVCCDIPFVVSQKTKSTKRGMSFCYTNPRTSVMFVNGVNGVKNMFVNGVKKMVFEQRSLSL